MICIKNIFITFTVILVIEIWVMPASAGKLEIWFKNNCIALITKYTLFNDNNDDFNNLNYGLTGGKWDMAQLNATLVSFTKNLKITGEVDLSTDTKKIGVIVEIAKAYSKFLDEKRHDGKVHNNPLTDFCGQNMKVFKKCFPRKK